MSIEITGVPFTLQTRTVTKAELRGDTGPQGPVGPQGPQGIQGPKGDKGDGAFSINDMPVGTVVTSTTPLSAPQWLPCDGRTYLQATYPLLAPKLAEDGSIPTYTLPPPASTPAASPTSIAFSDDGVYVGGTTSSASGPVFVYKRSGDALTKLASPVGVPSVTSASSCSFSGNADYFAVAYGGSAPYIEVHKREGDTFPTKASVSTTSTNVYGACLSADSTYLVLVRTTAPFIEVHKRSGDTFTKLPDFAEPPAASVNSGVALSPDGTYLVASTANNAVARNVYVYKRTGDTFALLTDDISVPVPARATFSKNGAYLAIRSSVLPGIFVFRRDGDVFTRLENSFSSSVPNAFEFVTEDTIAACHISSGMLYFKIKGDSVVRLHKDDSMPRQPNVLAAYNGPASSFDNYIAVGTSQFPYIYLMRDGYTYNPATEFQVPLETQFDERLSTYIKAS